MLKKEISKPSEDTIDEQEVVIFNELFSGEDQIYNRISNSSTHNSGLNTADKDDLFNPNESSEG